MKPNIEISEINLKASALLLNTLLADEYLLYTKTRSAHWNVQGQNFIELHNFLKHSMMLWKLLLIMLLNE